MGVATQGPRVVDRGPNWLFVRLPPEALTAGRHAHGKKAALADRLWELSSRHFTYRLVLELQDIDEIDDHAAEELHRLRRMLAEQGGALRLCGLPAKCSKKLRHSRRSEVLESHDSRIDAVCGESGIYSTASQSSRRGVS